MRLSSILINLFVFISWIPLCEGDLIDSVKRKLDWVFKNYVVDGNQWYYGYRDSEYEEGLKNPSDDENDYLWDTDKCPGEDGSYSRSNCPDPPNCTATIRNPEFGDPKLCINRAPLPWDKDDFYVIAMKCIPFWEGCDSCFCGNGNDPRCRYKGNKRSNPDDDKVEIDCKDPTFVKIRDEEFYPKKDKQEKPTSSPCIICDDDEDKKMRKKGEECTDDDEKVRKRLEKKCNKSKKWIKKKTCQLSCYNIGKSYDGDVCCNGNL